jgi:hypothetical protein
MSRPKAKKLPVPDAVLQRKVLELQEEEIEVERKKGRAELDHEAIDGRVTDRALAFVEQEPGVWTRTLLAKMVGRSRGTARQAKGPQVGVAGDQLALHLSRETLLPIDEAHSQFLGALVKKRDEVRLGKAAAIYEAESAKTLTAAQVALAKARGIRGVAATLQAGEDVEWADETEEAQAQAQASATSMPRD